MDSERILYYADASFPKALVDRLSLRGYALDAVRRGDDLLQKAFAERISLIIAFTEMQGLDGLSLCRDVKTNAGLKDIPVLVFAQRKGSDRSTYYAAGCDGFYDAPFDEVNVTQRIDELLVDRSTARRNSLARMSIDYKLSSEVLRLSPAEMQDGTIFLYAKTPLEMGARVKLTLSLFGKTLLDAYGEVTHAEPYRGNPGRPSGMAVRFYEMDDGSRRILDAMTRQRCVGNATWEELSAEAIFDKVRLAMQGGAAAGPRDPVLDRAGFDAAKLPTWEQAALASTAAADGGEVDLLAADLGQEIAPALREAATVLHKLNHHLSRYAELFYIGPVAAKRLAKHSEEVLGRAEAAADVLASFIDRVSKDASTNPQHAEHLTLAQDWLIEKMVRLRTVLADAQKPAEFAQPSVSDQELCPTQELRYRCLGLVELLDFSTQNSRKEYARTLPAEMDLSELSHFDVVTLIEGRLPASSMHPDLAAWARVLIARTQEILDFLRDRRPVRETKPERVEELMQFSQSRLTAVLELQDHFGRELRRLADFRAVSRAHLAELASTHRRLLQVAARLCGLYNLHLPSGGEGFGGRLVQAAHVSAEIVAPSEGATPLAIPTIGAEGAAGSAPKLAPSDTSPKAAAKKPAGASLGARLRKLFANKTRRLIIIAGGVALLVGGAAAAFFLTRSNVPDSGIVDVSTLQGLLPVKQCEIRKSAPPQPQKTLRCFIDAAWRKEPINKRRDALAKFVRALGGAGITVRGVVLVDPTETELAVSSGGSIRVFEH